MSSKRLDVVRVQFDGVAVAAMISTLLAGVVVPLENGFAPFSVFAFVTGYFVLVTFVYVPGPFRALRALCLFVGSRVGNFSTARGAHFAQHPALTVLRHWFAADWTLDHNVHAFCAHLIGYIKVVCTITAHLARNADASCICFRARGAGNASSIFDWFPQGGNCRSWLAALATLGKGSAIAFVTDAIVSAVSPAFDTPVLCHAAIIPQLPDLEKSA